MSLKTKNKQRKADYTDLQFCMDRPLLKELEQARAEAAEAAAGRMTGGKTTRVKELEKLIAEASVTIRVSSLPRGQYNELMLEHPPREGRDEVFNPETFFAAAAKASAVEVTEKSTVPIHEEDWDEFVDGLTDGEYDRLAGAVVMLNRNQATVQITPFG
ncbi:hypothetical protein [Leucobacter sp. M11]|uniref:hypothetical protein n=1 Tax=Leucobacter sp. M11 TaxID=2993565 RepID=UPI002D7E8CC2|nr:hypothetical protein [Leucobacter sp. M11]